MVKNIERLKMKSYIFILFCVLLFDSPIMAQVENSSENLALENETNLTSSSCTIPEFDGRWRGSSNANQWIPGFYPQFEVENGSIALTFDDGPMSRNRTANVLDILAELDVQATFFVVGRKITHRNYTLIQRMVNEGHRLANHSYHHDTSMYLIDNRSDPYGYMLAEFAINQAIVDIALLAESSEDFETLQDELLQNNAPRISEGRIARAWPEISERHQAILERRTASPHNSPFPMVYARSPGGSPFYGDWGPESYVVFAQVFRDLHLLNVMWTESAHDSSSDQTYAWRHDVDRITYEMHSAANEGAILLLHDRIDAQGLREGIERIINDPMTNIVTLDSIVFGEMQCSPDEISRYLQSL